MQHEMETLRVQAAHAKDREHELSTLHAETDQLRSEVSRLRRGTMMCDTMLIAFMGRGPSSSRTSITRICGSRMSSQL